MGFLAFLVLGGVAGWIASIVMKTDASQGLIGNVVIGVIGAYLGGFLFSLIGGAGFGEFSLYSLLVAVVGSVVLIWILKMIRG